MSVVHRSKRRGHVANIVVYLLDNITCQKRTSQGGRVLFIALDGVRSLATFIAGCQISLQHHLSVARLTLIFSNSYNFFTLRGHPKFSIVNHCNLYLAPFPRYSDLFFVSSWHTLVTEFGWYHPYRGHKCIRLLH